MPTRHTRILITGFDAFEKFKANPSQLLVESLPEKITGRGSGVSLEIETLVIPTCCNSAWSRLQRRLNSAQEPYSMLIMTGLANKRTNLSLERFALNIRDYRIKDNGGHVYDDVPIDKRGPDALRTDSPLIELKAALARKGFPSDISNHAGTFLCNEVYYRALRYQQQHKGLNDVLFIHIPQPGAYLKTIEALSQTHEKSRTAKNASIKRKDAVRRSDAVRSSAAAKSSAAVKRSDAGLEQLAMAVQAACLFLARTRNQR